MAHLIKKSVLMMIIIVSFIYAGDIEKLISEAKQLTKTGYYQFDKALFMKAKGLCERVLSNAPENSDALYYLTYSQFRLLNIMMANKETDGFTELFESTRENANKLCKSGKFRSEGKVLLAGANIYKLSTNPMLGITLAPTINSQIAEAIEEDNNNPRAYLLRGTMSYNTPKMFGGSVEKAQEDFQKALELYTNENDKGLTPSWGRYETMAWLGKSYVKLGQPDKAIEIYETALKENPNFSWIKYVLLPQVKKSGKSNSENVKIN
ncbi:MAG: tetratricopeptide repeat protein [Melioribacteraceae bacterium]|nr:tetratricopeptide repeat protein [Melioribacteraceae bacterium]